MTEDKIDTVLSLLDEWFTKQLSRLSGLAEIMQEQLRFNSAGYLEISDTTRRKLKSIAINYLEENDAVDGCGLIFSHSALGTNNGHLEWWVREDETRFARYIFGVVPGADRYYDYEQYDWFIRAFNDGAPALEGPYIDYLGVEVYVMTLTVPAVINGQRIGAVGNDIQIDDLEAELIPILLRTQSSAAVVNRRGNIVSSNSAEFLTGEQLANPPTGFEMVSIPGAAGEMSLVYQA